MKKLLLVTLLLLAGSFSVHAASNDFQEGSAYKKISPEQPTADPGKVEVVELFWYGCPHCHRFQVHIDRWLKTKPDNVNFIRMPAILNEEWALHARAFYSAQILGVLDKIHPALFHAIHEEKRKVFTEKALMAFFAEHGVNNDDFKKTFHSFAVDGKVRRAKQMTRRYRTRGTPTVVVNGKYTSGPGMAGSFTKLIDVINYLIEKETKAAL